MIQEISQKLQYLDETYQNLAPLGNGERKTIFLARNRYTGEIVAKKYVDAAVLPVYERLKQIQYYHLERIYDYAGDTRRGIVLTEYISGMTLHAYIERNGLVGEKFALDMIRELLETLEKVHRLGIIHRDINPDNIMISNDGVLKLIDFGIARQKKWEKSHDTTILGTVGYAAPEQFGFFQTDEKTDIYATGVLLNKLLTGRFPGEMLYRKEPVKSIIIQSTPMNANERFPNAASMLAALPQEHAGPMDKTFIVSWLPGFRTGKLWKNVVATIGYLLMIFYSVLSVMECSGTWQTCLLEMIAVFLYIWAAALLAANVANWDRHMIGVRKLPKAVMVVIRVFLWIFLFYYGYSLEIYVRCDLLGFPRPK